MLTYKELLTLTERKDWDAIVSSYRKGKVDFEAPSAYFCLSNAFINSNNITLAADLLNKGLEINSSNSWGRHLKYQIDIELYGTETAQDELYKFLSESGTHETLAATFINTAVRLGDFLRAKEINEARRVISGQKLTAPYAIALQTFCKADTLEDLLDSLLSCTGGDRFHLTIIQDAPNSKHSEKYTAGHIKVKNVINKYLNQLRDKFELVSLVTNYENLGTAPTCRKVLDRICDDYEGFVFLEDDCVLSKDALELASYLLSSEISIESNCWFGSLESTFYNVAEVDSEHVSGEVENAVKNNLQQGLYEIDFVPSTCFISNSEIWGKVKSFRSFPKGPESLTSYIKTIGKKTLLPVVPRARDKGMTHELGYSVHMLGKNSVKEHKHHFLDSNDFNVDTEYWKLPNTHEIFASKLKADS